MRLGNHLFTARNACQRNAALAMAVCSAPPLPLGASLSEGPMLPSSDRAAGKDQFVQDPGVNDCLGQIIFMAVCYFCT